jgi:glycosyltransferase involved in cell wall biosynthesis
MIEPVVSVVIPAFNAEKFIAEAIDSSLGQTLSNLEVLVVDNMSTDETLRIAQEFKDPRVHVYVSEKKGASAARNLGIEMAAGNYFQFLDADDLLAPDKIEKQLSAIIKRDPVQTIASGPWSRFERNPGEADSIPEEVWKIEDPVNWLICSLSGGGMMQTGSWLVHRELVTAAGPWNESLSLHDDGEFFTRVLLRAKSQVFVPEAIVYYRSVRNSLSRQRNRSAIESAFRVCQLREKYLLTAIDNHQVRVAVATQYAQFAYEFLEIAPDLARQSLVCIRDLGVKPVSSVGGKGFRKLRNLLGFSAALVIRRLFGLFMRQPTG